MHYQIMSCAFRERERESERERGRDGGRGRGRERLVCKWEEAQTDHHKSIAPPSVRRLHPAVWLYYPKCAVLPVHLSSKQPSRSTLQL